MDDLDHHPLPHPMAKTTRIIRSSISIFLQDLPHFSSVPALLALPFALSALLTPSLVSSSRLFPPIHARLQALLLASGFPSSSHLFNFFNLKLTHTLLSFIFLLPFSLSSLLLSKASVVRALFRHFTSDKNPFLSWISTLNPLITTHFCSVLVTLSVNATCFSLSAVCFNALEFSGISYSKNALLLVSAAGVVAYSITVVNAHYVCHLAVIVSGVEGRGGFWSVLEACVLVRGRVSTVLGLAVSVSAALAGVEALFQQRVVRVYGGAAGGLGWPVVLEAVLIGYMYALVLVVDAIAGCVFLGGCQRRYEMIGRTGSREREGRRVFWREEKVSSDMVE